MSEESYQQNVVRGVTGRLTGTCLLASYDRISRRTEISTESYVFYEQTRREYFQACGDNPVAVPDHIVKRYRDAKTMFRQDLGVNSSRNIIEARVDTLDDLRSTLNRLCTGGFRPAVYLDVGGLHGVGVVRLSDDYYDVKSTWTPFRRDDPVDIQELYEYLDRAPRLRKRETNSRRTGKQVNIVALPPEARKRR